MALQFPMDTNIKYEAKVSFQALKLKAIDVASLFSASGINLVGSTGGRGSEAEHRSLNGDDAGVNTIVGTGQEIEARLGTCTLFLPQSIQFNDAAQYDNMDLGILGAGTEAGLKAGSALIPTLVDETVKGVRSIIDGITGGTALGTPLGRLAVTRAANLIPSGEARGAVRSGTRTAINPNTRALFKQIPLREFTFNFKMLPSSKEETKNIKDIIKFFRTEMYPEVIKMGSGPGAISAGYEFPNVFEINMYYGDVNNQLASRILPSYLRNFTTTYNASGMGFYEGGDFTEVDITMTFVESSTLHKALIAEGY